LEGTVVIVVSTRANATIDLVSSDEQASVPELIVTIRLKLGSGPVSPETVRITELIERLASGDAAPALPSRVVANDDPDLVTVFPAARTVLRGATDIALTRREFDLLLCFAENPLRVFTRAQLLAQVWDTEYTGQRSVDVHVLRLRAKLGMDVPLVMTLRGVGYRLHGDAKVVVMRDR
jgi:DNA-binding response OmpR family regulator